MHERRRFLKRVTLAGSALLLAGCDRISQSSWGPKVLGLAEPVNYRLQGLLAPNSAMAKEFTEADISKVFRGNGTTDPQTAAYQQLADNDFRDYQLEVGGLVDRPGKFSIDALKQIGQRTQITRHDCVEGWSVIGKWTGSPLAALLANVGVKRGARYVVFHCFDNEGLDRYYESIDLSEANHAQTLLAFMLNDAPLPITNGAPLRLRVPRQLGYKQAKYIQSIDVVASLKPIAGGNGGYWEDQGYAWYAGI